MRSYGPELLLISLLLGLALVSPAFPLLGALGFLLYFHSQRPWGFLLDHHPSQNLLAWKGEGEKACLTLVRLQDGVPPDWHWPTDTFARVDEEALKDTLAYARALLRQVWTSG